MSKLLRHLPVALAAALAAGCAPDFTEPSQVTGLRVLAVLAEPPELAPPGDGSAAARATLATLVAHPAFATDGARRATVLHLGCTPSPDPSVPSLCTAISELASPEALLGLADLDQACAAPGLGTPGAITFAGLESCGRDGCEPVEVRLDPSDPASTVALPTPGYELPTALDLSALPAGDPTRVLGLEAVDLALALDAAPADLAPAAPVGDACQALGAVAVRLGELWESRPHVAALKRIRVRGPDAVNPPNQNPAVTGIALGGVALPAPGAADPADVGGGARVDLLPLHPGDPDQLRETYVEVDAEGVPVREKKEEWTWAWFTSAGSLADPYTRAADQAAELTAPGSGRALVWLVLRDLRGGLAFTSGVVEAIP
jgi:hypothetical protein